MRLNVRKITPTSSHLNKSNLGNNKTTTPLSIIAKNILLKKKDEMNLTDKILSKRKLASDQDGSIDSKKAKFDSTKDHKYNYIESDDDDDAALLNAANQMDKGVSLITKFKEEKIDKMIEYDINKENCLDTGLEFNCHKRE
jgi:hypothetical protein